MTRYAKREKAPPPRDLEGTIADLAERVSWLRSYTPPDVTRVPDLGALICMVAASARHAQYLADKLAEIEDDARAALARFDGREAKETEVTDEL